MEGDLDTVSDASVMYGDQLSCLDNDYSLVDSLIFIDSQDYMYRTINRRINDDHTEESLMDVVANIALVVESEKGLFWVTAVV